MTCFDEGQMAPFPIQGQRHSEGVVYTEDIPVYCHGKLPNDSKMFMVDNEGSFGWFH